MVGKKKTTGSCAMLGEEVKSYLDELAKTLPTQRNLTTIKEEFSNKFDEQGLAKIKTLENRVVLLKSWVEKAERKAEALESRMVRDNATELLKKAVDDQEPLYSRRNSVRVPIEETKAKDVMFKMRACLEEMGRGEEEDDIDCGHEIGKPKLS